MDPASQEPDDATTLHVGRAIRGDAASLSWVVERFTPLLLAQARHRLGPRLAREVDPEDVVNQVWLMTLPKLHDLGSRDGRSTPVLLRFLSTAVLNRVNNLVSRSLRRGSHAAGQEGGASDVLAELSATITGAYSRCVRGESCTAVLAAIDALSREDRAVIVLRAIEQRSNGEASEALGLAPNTVAARYSRALARLRASLPESLLAEV